MKSLFDTLSLMGIWPFQLTNRWDEVRFWTGSCFRHSEKVGGKYLNKKSWGTSAPRPVQRLASKFNMIYNLFPVSRCECRRTSTEVFRFRQHCRAKQRELEFTMMMFQGASAVQPLTFNLENELMLAVFSIPGLCCLNFAVLIHGLCCLAFHTKMKLCSSPSGYFQFFSGFLF